MSNAVIGFPRWTDKCTFSGGAWDADYPASNLKIEPLAQVARTTDLVLTNTQFAATLDKPRGIRLLALVRHNLSLDALIRIRIYDDAGMTALLYDSGWIDVWPEVYAPDQLEWEDDNWWSRKYTTDEITGYIWSRPFWLDQLYLGTAIKVELDDQTNSDSVIDVGMFEVAQGWQVGTNFEYGAQYGFRGRTSQEEADGGVKYFTRKDKPRVFKGNIGFLDRDEAKAKAFEHQRQMDIDIPFFWFPAPDDTFNWLRDAFLAKNTDMGLLGYASHNRDSVPLNLEEVL
jgi:hypothetical protein